MMLNIFHVIHCHLCIFLGELSVQMFFYRFCQLNSFFFLLILEFFKKEDIIHILRLILYIVLDGLWCPVVWSNPSLDLALQVCFRCG